MKECKKESALMRKAFGEEGLVSLSEDEYKKLCQRFGRRLTKEYIQRVENWKLQKSKNRYENDYRGLLTWFSRAKDEGRLKVSWDDFDERDFDSNEQFMNKINNLK